MRNAEVAPKCLGRDGYKASEQWLEESQGRPTQLSFASVFLSLECRIGAPSVRARGAAWRVFVRAPGVSATGSPFDFKEITRQPFSGVACGGYISGSKETIFARMHTNPGEGT